MMSSTCAAVGVKPNTVTAPAGVLGPLATSGHRAGYAVAARNKVN